MAGKSVGGKSVGGKSVGGKSVGIVKYHGVIFTGKHQKLHLQYGGKLENIHVCYEHYGELNAEGTNAILIIHSLTGNHHAAGKYAKDDRYPGWWDPMIGPGKAFDTNKYYVLCCNNLGGCDGTTGPNSLDPKTQKPYGLRFPIISIADMVQVQYLLMRHLKISKFHTIAGASMGGMMAMYWGLHHADLVENAIAIATTAAQGAQSIAFSEVGRQAIMSDPQWKQGRYFSPSAKEKQGPLKGLAVARMLAHITYLSAVSMKRKFGRQRQSAAKPNFTSDPQFQVESYLQHQGKNFIDRFDANSYIYITKALNYFDLALGFSSLSHAFAAAKARFLFISFSSDWIYTKEMSLELLKAALDAKKRGYYFEVVSDAGHDAFLLEHEKLTEITHAFLRNGEKSNAAKKPPPKKTLLSSHSSISSPSTTFDEGEHSLSTPDQTNEFAIIASQIAEHARVLDIGCGDGTLLSFCRTQKQILPHGIEKDPTLAMRALAKNIILFQGTIEEGLALYKTNSFDVTILSRTIQQLEEPRAIIDGMLRISRTAVISFLNYGYFRNRFRFLLEGRKPQSRAFPHSWFASPDRHLISIRDFETYISARRYTIKNRTFLKGDWLRQSTLFPNLFAGIAIYVLENP